MNNQLFEIYCNHYSITDKLNEANRLCDLYQSDNYMYDVLGDSSVDFLSYRLIRVAELATIFPDVQLSVLLAELTDKESTKSFVYEVLSEGFKDVHTLNAVASYIGYNPKIAEIDEPFAPIRGQMVINCYSKFCETLSSIDKSSQRSPVYNTTIHTYKEHKELAIAIDVLFNDLSQALRNTWLNHKQAIKLFLVMVYAGLNSFEFGYLAISADDLTALDGMYAGNDDVLNFFCGKCRIMRCMERLNVTRWVNELLGLLTFNTVIPVDMNDYITMYKGDSTIQLAVSIRGELGVLTLTKGSDRIRVDSELCLCGLYMCLYQYLGQRVYEMSETNAKAIESVGSASTFLESFGQYLQSKFDDLSFMCNCSSPGHVYSATSEGNYHRSFISVYDGVGLTNMLENEILVKSVLACTETAANTIANRLSLVLPKDASVLDVINKLQELGVDMSHVLSCVMGGIK